MDTSKTLLSKVLLKNLGATDVEIDILRRNGYVDSPIEKMQMFSASKYSTEPLVDYDLFKEMIDAIKNAYVFNRETIGETWIIKETPYFGQREITLFDNMTMFPARIIYDTGWDLDNLRVDRVTYYGVKDCWHPKKASINKLIVKAIATYVYCENNKLVRCNVRFMETPETIQIQYDGNERVHTITLSGKEHLLCFKKITYRYEKDGDIEECYSFTENPDSNSYLRSKVTKIKNHLEETVIFDVYKDMISSETKYMDKNGRVIAVHRNSSGGRETVKRFIRDDYGNIDEIIEDQRNSIYKRG